MSYNRSSLNAEVHFISPCYCTRFYTRISRIIKRPCNFSEFCMQFSTIFNFQLGILGEGTATNAASFTILNLYIIVSFGLSLFLCEWQSDERKIVLHEASHKSVSALIYFSPCLLTRSAIRGKLCGNIATRLGPFLHNSKFLFLLQSFL